MKQELSFITGGIAKWYEHLRRQFWNSYKTRFNLTIKSRNHTLYYSVKWFENLRSHRNLCYNSFIHNCQNLEGTNMSCQIDKSWHIHTMGYYSVLRRHELWRQREDTEEPQTDITRLEKEKNLISSILWNSLKLHSEDNKTIEKRKSLVAASVWRKKRVNK